LLAALLVLPVGCGGGSGRPTGPPTPIPHTVRTYTGRIGYFVTGPRIGSLDADGRLVPQAGFITPNNSRPMPDLRLEVLDDTGALLGIAFTDASGNYSVTVNHGPKPAPPVRVRAVTTATRQGSTFRVLPRRGAPGPYEYSSPLTTDPGTAMVPINLAVPLAQGAAAFHICEVVSAGLSVIQGGIFGTLPNVDVFWEPGNGAVSTVTRVNPGLAEIVIAGGIAGNDASNQDAWDEPQIMRILGELFLVCFSNSVAPPGEADGTLLVPSVAWREGFLDFFACAGRGTPEFWDTEGTGAAGRVVRYFNAESFFDPALGSLGADDPNVYQDPAVTGIGSRFTVTEVLWDILDSPTADEDADVLSLPLFLMLRDLEALKPGESYPYLYTALDQYVTNLSFTGIQADIILARPENQGLSYPPDNGSVWPTSIHNPAAPANPIVAPFDRTYSDHIDNTTPPANEELGLMSLRYFGFELGATATASATVTSAASLRVDILDLENRVIAGGAPAAVAALQPGAYVVRVSSAAGPVAADFDLRIQLTP
jgi:hypothetical protein